MPNDFYVPNVNGQSLLESALAYSGQGFSVVPINKAGKHPPVKWIPYQTDFPTTDTLHEWFGEGGSYEHQMIGIITGRLSDLSVIDIDTEEAKDRFKTHMGDDLPRPEENPIIKTPRGWHIYYPYTPDIQTGAEVWGIEGLDGRSEGGLVVAPPSVNHTGGIYKRLEGKQNG